MSSDQNRFENLFEQHWSMLYEIAYRKTGSEDDAKDLTQDLFVSLWTSGAWEHISGEDKNYLLRALRNRLLNYYRDKGVDQRHEELFMRINIAVPGDALSNLTALELERLIDTEIAKLPTKMREIFLLSRVEDLSVEEIATKLDIAPQTVKNQITETLKRLRHGLRHYPISVILLALLI